MAVGAAAPRCRSDSQHVTHGVTKRASALGNKAETIDVNSKGGVATRVMATLPPVHEWSSVFEVHTSELVEAHAALKCAASCRLGALTLRNGRELGKGGFASVYAAVASGDADYICDNETVAVKARSQHEDLSSQSNGDTPK